MKKEYALLFIAAAFIAGVVVGVIAAVTYEDRSPAMPTAMSPQAQAPQDSGPSPAELQKQITMLQSILKQDPKNLKALVELGNAYFDINDADNAIANYSKALEIDPRNPDVRTDMGIMYRRKKDFDRAVAEFKRAAADSPQHVNSRYNLGVVLLHDKMDIKAAIATWEDYLKLEPSGPRSENIRKQLDKMRAMSK